MKPIPWEDLAGAIHLVRKGHPVARALLSEHVADFVAEGEARSRPEIDFRSRLDSLLSRVGKKPLPLPVSPVAVPAPYQDPDAEEDAA